jgi:Protein of unknown function (DUF2905)
MPGLGRILIFLGLVLTGVGIIVLGLERLHLPLGRLPGDLSWRGRGWSVSFPLVTCLLLSILFSLIVWIVNSLRR